MLYEDFELESLLTEAKMKVSFLQTRKFSCFSEVHAKKIFAALRYQSFSLDINTLLSRATVNPIMNRIKKGRSQLLSLVGDLMH